MNTASNRVTYLNPDQKTCPKCGGSNIVSVSRITGYLSFDERFCESKVAERLDRVSHNDNSDDSLSSCK